MAQTAFQAPAYRILVVDDNEINREVALASLEPYGCQLSQAESGAEAIELVRSSLFDMILMDYLMPGMDGIETTQKIRTTCGVQGETPVIIALTAEESPEMLERFCQSGFQEVLAKPIDPQRLHQALERWIPAEQRQTLSEPVLAPEAAEEDLTALAVEGIDLERVAQSKTKAQYLQLLALFSREGRRSLPLWQTVEREQLEDYRIWVHGVKSASANIGAMEVSALAREQENAAKAGDLASVQAGRPALFAKYGRLLEEIDRVVQAQTADGGEEGPALDGEALLTELRQALDALEHFRSKESAKVLEHLLRCRIPAETREILQQVREKLRLYEDDDAEDQLREMITKFNAKECHGGLE